MAALGRTTFEAGTAKIGRQAVVRIESEAVQYLVPILEHFWTANTLHTPISWYGAKSAKWQTGVQIKIEKEFARKSHFCFAAVALAATGCSPAQPRGEQYFSAHIAEAKQVVADCANGTARGDECYNAEVAVSKAKARERTEKLGQKIKQH